MNHSQLNANFSTLVLSIGSAAMMNLGLSPNPESGKFEKNLDIAKYNIDLISVLQKKTKNNLDSEEQHLIESMLHDLQIRFVEAKK